MYTYGSDITYDVSYRGVFVLATERGVMVVNGEDIRDIGSQSTVSAIDIALHFNYQIIFYTLLLITWYYWIDYLGRCDLLTSLFSIYIGGENYGMESGYVCCSNMSEVGVSAIRG